ncbi:hypothetical protein AAEX28_11690 [Lentisphaerota bacterium WC36G]|nr:hypothetical protein LJT99_14525 [Lentisphaerae bacterium WC36]
MKKKVINFFCDTFKRKITKTDGVCAVNESIIMNFHNSTNITESNTFKLLILKSNKVVAIYEQSCLGNIISFDMKLDSLEIAEFFKYQKISATLNFNILLWDVSNEKLLINDEILIQNNKFNYEQLDNQTVLFTPLIEYSFDGTNWFSSASSVGTKFVRFSFDSGASWTSKVELNLLKGDKGDTGDKGADGTMIFSDLTEEQKESLKGDKGETGDKGDPFIYEDFTPEQLLGLKGDTGDTGEKGDKGDPFTFNDMTEEQKSEIATHSHNHNSENDQRYATKEHSHSDLNTEIEAHQNSYHAPKHNLWINPNRAINQYNVDNLKSKELSGVLEYWGDRHLWNIPDGNSALISENLDKTGYNVKTGSIIDAYPDAMSNSSKCWASSSYSSTLLPINAFNKDNSNSNSWNSASNKTTAVLLRACEGKKIDKIKLTTRNSGSYNAPKSFQVIYTMANMSNFDNVDSALLTEEYIVALTINVTGFSSANESKEWFLDTAIPSNATAWGVKITSSYATTVAVGELEGYTFEEQNGNYDILQGFDSIDRANLFGNFCTLTNISSALMSKQIILKANDNSNTVLDPTSQEDSSALFDLTNLSVDDYKEIWFKFNCSEANNKIENLIVNDGKKYCGVVEVEQTLEVLRCQKYTQIRSSNNVEDVDLRTNMRATPTITAHGDNYLYNSEIQY